MPDLPTKLPSNNLPTQLPANNLPTKLPTNNLPADRIEQLLRDRLQTLEAQILNELETLKQRCVVLQALPQRSQLNLQQQAFERQFQQLRQRHRQNKAQRQSQRQAIPLDSSDRQHRLEQLNQQSRRDGRERRELKQSRDQALGPLQQAIAQADTELCEIKRRRKALCQQLQSEMQWFYHWMILRGTGSYSNHYRPSSQDQARDDLVLLYEDDWVIAVEKPAGLLSVPGRSLQNQESVLSRLRLQLLDQTGQPLGDRLQTIHRLDQDTSGILLLAKGATSQRRLQQQFQQQQISKTYEALLQGSLSIEDGWIDLPLAADPDRRPRQQVNHDQGKPSQTRFIRLARSQGVSRVRFEPITGRTHQLRVHAAEGLGLPIVGDRLYGSPAPQSQEDGSEAPAEDYPGDRLCLHACQLSFQHPFTDEEITLRSQVPF